MDLFAAKWCQSRRVWRRFRASLIARWNACQSDFSVFDYSLQSPAGGAYSR
jgi:hypothetical protein